VILIFGIWLKIYFHIKHMKYVDGINFEGSFELLNPRSRYLITALAFLAFPIIESKSKYRNITNNKKPVNYDRLFQCK